MYAGQQEQDTSSSIMYDSVAHYITNINLSYFAARVFISRPGVRIKMENTTNTSPPWGENFIPVIVTLQSIIHC